MPKGGFKCEPLFGCEREDNRERDRWRMSRRHLKSTKEDHTRTRVLKMHFGSTSNIHVMNQESVKLDQFEECNYIGLKRLIGGVSLSADDTETDWIRLIPSKGNIYLRRVLYNRLPTLDNLIRRGVSLPSSDCPLCHDCTENLDHVMTSCSTAKIINAHTAKWVGWWPSKVFKGAVVRDNDTVREIQTVAFNWLSEELGVTRGNGKSRVTNPPIPTDTTTTFETTPNPIKS
ncbi:hypothetical protein OSB04_010371 [Centaurea solstitialis]|uniref:Reverse transcriptase zinc-binding domain-containing protein n=1 Tax=Centaurea solstitialis TaxID=347529 RepID=A0AA38WBW3_9ASTR|nr:hypothetical protein OSB04_010371 [Centaurea solstitialis]